jgi:hypothetical protein
LGDEMVVGNHVIGKPAYSDGEENGRDKSGPIGINLRERWFFRERNTGSERFQLPMKVKDRREAGVIMAFDYLIYKEICHF